MLADIIHKIAGMDKETTIYPYYPRPSLADPARCLRQLDYWKQKYLPEPLSGRSVLVLDDSSWHEELVADWIRKSAYRLHSEQMQVESNGLKGHIDGILTDLAGNDYLWEQKAINHFQFQRYSNLNEMPEGYFVQIAFYLDGLQKVNPDIKKAILLIKNKNTAQFIEFVVQYTPDVLEVLSFCDSQGKTVLFTDITRSDILAQAMERFRDVDRYAAAGKLHERQYTLGKDWQCDYCQWGKTCWDNYTQEIKEYADCVTDNEYATTLQRFHQMKKQIDDLECEVEKIRTDIIKRLKSLNAKKIKAGDWTAGISVQNQSRVDTKALPPDIVKQFSKTSMVERLTVKHINDV